MRPPCEIAIKEYLPVLRYYMARELRKRGLKQTQISKMLGITQAAVSGYLSKPLRANSDIKEFVSERIEKIINDLMTNYSASRLISWTCSICYELRAGGGICVLHKKAIPELESENCNICETIPYNQTKEYEERIDALNHMKIAINILKQQEGMDKLVPEVMMNLVYAIKDAKSTQDVVAIPGRIVKIKNKVKPSATPAFGGSEHMSKLVIQIMNYYSNARAMICIDANERVLDAIKKLKLNLLMGEDDKNATEEQIISNCLLKTKVSLPFAILVPEGPGRESLIYIIDSLPEKVSELAIKIAKELIK